jgi:hypothetical protein
MKRYLAWVLCAGIGFCSLRADEGWRTLWNQKDLDGWETYIAKPDKAWDVPGLTRNAAGEYTEAIGLNRDPLKVFTVEQVDGRSVVHVSGQGFGVMTTKESFGNIHLRLQVKWGERRWGSRANAPRDSGLLYFQHGPHGFAYGTWPRSVEFQIQEHDMGDLWAIGTRVSVPARQEGKLFLYDPKAERVGFMMQQSIGNRCVKLGDPEKPKGEWNTLELICFNGDSIHIVNGVVVMRLYHAQQLDAEPPTPLTSGQISLQTEGAEVYYRDIEVKPITEIPEAWRER